MTTKDDGGPAFPMSSVDGYEQTGMTLRQWFAGQALASPAAYGPAHAPDIIAARAYALADAMIAKGNKDGAP